MSGETAFYIGNNGDIFLDNHRAIVFITGATHSGSTWTGNTGILDPDGNEYTEITISGQTWLVENYRTTTDWSGNSIDYKWYNNSYETGLTYGALYPASVLTADIYPVGYRLPTRDDYMELMSYIDPTSSIINNNFPICSNTFSGPHFVSYLTGDKLMTKGTNYWSISGGTNDYGFNLRGGGGYYYYYDFGGDYYLFACIKSQANLWYIEPGVDYGMFVASYIKPVLTENISSNYVSLRCIKI